MGDLESRLDTVLSANPDRIFVLDGEDSVEAALIQGVDDGAPVDLAEDAARCGSSRVAAAAADPASRSATAARTPPAARTAHAWTPPMKPDRGRSAIGASPLESERDVDHTYITPFRARRSLGRARATPRSGTETLLISNCSTIEGANLDHGAEHVRSRLDQSVGWTSRSSIRIAPRSRRNGHGLSSQRPILGAGKNGGPRRASKIRNAFQAALTRKSHETCHKYGPAEVSVCISPLRSEAIDFLEINRADIG
jgi:hypothetical protein